MKNSFSAKEDIQTAKDAPQKTIIGRVDEVSAAKFPILQWNANSIQ